MDMTSATLHTAAAPAAQGQYAEVAPVRDARWVEEQAPDRSSPTARRRRLAAELHRLRDRAGLTGDQVAERFGWSPSKISRIENARSGLKVPDARKLLDIYGVQGAHRDELLTLAQDAERKGWWESYAAGLPAELVEFIGMEAEAASAWNWEPLVIPGLLQTRDYAHAVISAHMRAAAMPSPREIGERVEVQLARQQVLACEQPLMLRAVLDESVLLRCFGSGAVMRGQLEWLARAAELPNVDVRVLPLGSPHPIASGGFVLLEFDKTHQAPLGDVVYSENLNGAICIKGDGETYRHRLAFERLLGECADPAVSGQLISRAAREAWV
jgi:transcriptional regulator with XRE-family HTH domain